MSSPNSRAASSSRWRALAGKVGLAVVGPLLFFVALEGALRLAGFGANTDFFIPDDQPGFFRTNPRFTELFLPASFGLKPVNFRLPREKPAGSYRVFVLGESAAMGVPEPAFSLAPQLQAQLRATHPGKTIEVSNLGITAINSHAILRIVQQAVGFHPDLLVIYMGNNEVVGPYGPGSVATGSVPPRGLIRIALLVRATRTGQLMQRLVAALRPVGAGFKDWRGMEMFADKTVAPDDPRLVRVRGNFAANLEDMLALAHAAGVKVVLSTVAVNLRDSAPFASAYRASTSAAAIAEAGRERAAAEDAADLGRLPEAASDLARALAGDSAHADTHFRLARALEATGKAEVARTNYLAALEQDRLRFRADEAINTIVRSAAAQHGGDVLLVDAAQALGSDPASTVPPAGANLFFEHVHFRWEGNFALARLIAPAAAQALFNDTGSSRPWLESAACADAVGYTELGQLAMLHGMADLTDRPPFTGQSTFAEDRARFARDIAATESALAQPGAVDRAAAKIWAALQGDPQNPALLFQAAALRLQLRDFTGALALEDRLSAVAPPSAEQAVQRAFVLNQLGRPAEAEALLLASAKTEPYYFQTYGVLGQLWAKGGQTDRALAFFKTLTQKMPDSRAAHASYAQFLAHQGDLAAAEAEWRTILRLVPDDESALGPLLELLERAGRHADATTLMENAYAYNPRNFTNDVRLVRIADEKYDLAAKARYLEAVAASGPVNPRLYIDLAAVQRDLGRPDEARRALVRARRTAGAAGDHAMVQAIEAMLTSIGPGS